MNRITWDRLWMTTAQLVGQRSRCIRRQAGSVIVSPTNKIISVGYNGPAPDWTHDHPLIVHAPGLDEPYETTRVCSLRDGETCDSFCPRATTGGGTANYDDCVTIHSETNAIIAADGADLKGASLYVYPGAPCLTCMKTICGAGVKNIFYVTHHVDKDRRPELALDYANHVDGVTVHELPWP